MNLTRFASTAFACTILAACSGNKDAAPVTDPTPTPAPASQEQKISLENPVDRYSYALGMDLGKAIANITVPIKMDVLIAAINDQVDSTRTPLMSDSVSESALQDMLLQMQQKKEADEAAAARKSLEEQAQFLAKNVLDSTVKTTPKGVQYKVLKDAKGISPKASDKVKVHYVGALLNGTEFDNSVKRGEPLEFPVSAVIEGWQDLLLVMQEGMKVKAWIPSALAYGEAGVPPMIPANSLLVFEVELLKVFAEAPVDAAPAPASDSAAVNAASAPAAQPAEAAQPAAQPATAAPAEVKPAAEPAKATPAEAKAAPAKPAAKADAKPAAKPATQPAAAPAKK
ncbi:MAG: FKBP-type peptidyl-prolyl cis-trans isomerase [Fibrobacter sp.]|nr:FKBP-type peptidyl-prolyl cis-trans isomerase [Fibrobacter sp.]